MIEAPPTRAGPRALVVPLFSSTLFVSAGLLFLVQPMVAKFVLPLFGSTPAVWTAALLFFQATLLLGYVYAHVSTTRLGVRRAAALHAGLLLLPLLVLPVRVPDQAGSLATDAPALALLGLLAVTVGLPFFVVSSTAPLLQRFLAGTDHPAGRDPYFLYRASNLGSMLGLLGYPFLVEPALRLPDQGRAWSLGYGALALLLLGCLVVVARLAAGGGGAATPEAGSATGDRPLGRARPLRWLALAFVPSSLVLGVTGFLTTDVAPIPLLWVIPLALYLLSFILVFSPSPRAPLLHRVMVVALPLVLAGVAVVYVQDLREPLRLVVAAHLGALFVTAMVCHGELARDRPAPEHLTAFYLWMALGGVLGGAFNALVAPLVFDGFTEYPLAIALACLLRPVRRPWPARTRLAPVLDLGWPLGLGVAVVVGLRAIEDLDPYAAETASTLLWVVAVAVCLCLASRPLRLALAIVALFVGGTVAGERG